MEQEWAQAGVIEFTTSTGLHEGYDMYETIEELENSIRWLVHDGYVITRI